MSYQIKILADSLAPSGKRLTTFEATYPRFVHSELMTHRLFSRNSASSRAIPVSKMIKQVSEDPVLPVYWGKNQSGMVAQQELSEEERESAKLLWLAARQDAILWAEMLDKSGVHKQIVNRLLEPWMWITTIISATEWSNFFHLRTAPDAQPELKHLADMMLTAYLEHTPEQILPGDWHLPLIHQNDLEARERGEINGMNLVQISVGRCARVSYLTHDGKRDLTADIELHDRLAISGHWSPFEHVAKAMSFPGPSGNYVGFEQYRKSFTSEHFGWPGE